MVARLFWQSVRWCDCNHTPGGKSFAKGGCAVDWNGSVSPLPRPPVEVDDDSTCMGGEGGGNVRWAGRVDVESLLYIHPSSETRLLHRFACSRSAKQWEKEEGMWGVDAR